MAVVSAAHLRASQVRRVGAAFLRLRAVIVVPALIGFSAVMWLTGEPPVRAGVVTLILGVMLVFFVSEAVVFRSRGVAEGYLAGSMLLTQLAITAVGVATGGLSSPAVPLLLAPSGVGLAAFGTSVSGRLTLAGLGGCLLGLAVGGEILAWPPLHTPVRQLMTLLTTAMCGVLLYFAVGKLSDAYVTAGADLSRARSALLAEATFRARDLEAMGSRVAHELKNPLAAAKGLIELVGAHTADERQSQRLSVALSELDRLTVRLRDYLAFARPLSPLQLELIDLRQWLADLMHSHEGLASHARVSLSWSCEGSQARWLADGPRLRDALANLLSNAIAACESEDAVELRCEIEADSLTILVNDTGVGMTADVLARLGTPFFTTKDGGTGLGVVLARTTIVQHGGQLTFTSDPEQGTVAKVELPRLRNEEQLWT